jgi:hypothetical protein
MKLPAQIALVAAAVAVGMYAAASITASTLAGTFDTEAATTHSRFAGFETALKRASTEYREARGKSDGLARTKRNLCNAEARADERRAFLRDTDHKETTP